MKVVFRVDASNSIGSGHLVRCMSLATELQKRGAECIFIGRELKGHLFQSVVDAGFHQRVMPTGEETSNRSTVTDIPSFNPNQDALHTIQALEGERPSWLIVDHYGIGEEWEILLRPHVDGIFIIDDFSDRHHDCDLLLNQNFNTFGNERYLGLVPTYTRLLLGPRYALLQPQFSGLRKSRPPKHTGRLTALISFGGSDIDNLTGLVLDVLGQPEFRDIAIEVAIGANNPHQFELERKITGRRHSRAHFDPENMAELMAHSDFAIGAGGSTTWERLCLDLPSIVIAIAQNQIATCEMLSLHHAINYLGFWTEVQADNVKEAIRITVAALGKSNQKSYNPIVDGLGAERVAEALVMNSDEIF